MKLIKSQAVTDTTLTYSSVPENDFAAWDATITYAEGDQVIVTTPNIHKIYKSKAGGNHNNDPVTDTSHTYWSDEGSTNRWKMFNQTIQQQTTSSNVTETITVTVSGGKFLVNGVSQDTLTLYEGSTYQFDQSDATNGTHPLRLSETSDGTHGGGGVEYTTGVTTAGTPGSGGAYTQIVVAADAPTLYYYCSNHSGMGGQADTLSGGFNVTITPNQIVNGLSVVNCSTESITIKMIDPTEGTVFNQTFSMVSDSGITSWYDYFFTPIGRDADLAVLTLPAYSSAAIKVFFNDAGTAKVGALVLGTVETIGDSQYGASFGIIDYSTKTTDSAGNVTITAGSYSDTADIDVIIETARFSAVKKILTDARTTPSVWIAEENTDGLIIYGYFREFSILMTNPTVSLTTLSIEGLT